MLINARSISADAVCSVYTKGTYLSEAVAAVRRSNVLSNVDMAFVNELVHGVLKYKIRIDYIISKMSDIKLKKILPYVLSVMECAVYQIVFMDKIPDSAAVNEAVKLIKDSRYFRSAGYVNAVLRKVADSKDRLDYPKDELNNFSVYCSLPLWLAKRWVSSYGMDEAKRLAKAYLKKGDTTLRCNLLKITPCELLENLKKSGIECNIFSSEFTDIDYILSCSSVNGLESLEDFKKGHFYVQDFAAALTVEILSPCEGETVIDMCAAPGGKTTHMAEKMKNKGRIIAFDIHSHKLKKINENASRLGIDIIEAKTADSTFADSSLYGIADKVLADVPCSGLGILTKKPDIKYFRKEEDIYSLAQTGFEILTNAAKYVKKGGVLVFSTCTTEREENEDVVNKFLSENSDFELVPIKEYKRENPGYLTLFPHTDGCDGFFICKMKKL